MSNYNDDVNWKGISILLGSVVAIIVLIITLLMAGLPIYNVWRQSLSGKGELLKAEQTRQILVTQAQAEKEAASLRAEAIAIVGQAAKDFPEYRQQEFIGAFAEALHNGTIQQIIYVPTEANIPILEATRIKP